jgi:hypothetical protein
LDLDLEPGGGGGWRSSGAVRVAVPRGQVRVGGCVCVWRGGGGDEGEVGRQVLRRVWLVGGAEEEGDA